MGGCNAEAGSISSAVVSLRLALVNGSVLSVTDGDLLYAARASLGTLGIITEVTLQAVPSYKLRTPSRDDQLKEDTADFMARHVQYLQDNPYTHLFFYTPKSSAHSYVEGEYLNRMMVRTQEVCTDDADDCKIWYKAQTRTDTPDGADQLIKTYETEINVDVDEARAVVQEFRDMVANKAEDIDDRVDWSFSARYVGEEDTWLAPAYNRSSLHLTLLMHCVDVGEPDAYFWTYAGVSNFSSYGVESEPVAGERITDAEKQQIASRDIVIAEAVKLGDFGDGFLVDCKTDWIQKHLHVFGQGLETIAYRHGGRPHMGKENNVKANHLAEVFPQYAAFNKLRAEFDPAGILMNSHLEDRLTLPSDMAVV